VKLITIACGSLAGENCERVGAEIGPHGIVTAYMAPQNREARIERVSFIYTRGLDEGLSMLLVKMTLRAKDELQKCVKELESARKEIYTILGQENPNLAEAMVSTCRNMLCCL
jgi:hypothetical protein